MRAVGFDKIVHFVVGFVLGAIFPDMWGLVIAIVAGILKEVRDLMGAGKPEVNDAVATILGGILGWIFRKIIGL